jgi:hypothetical protein
MKPVAKRNRLHLRFRKNDPAHNLLAAAQHWLKSNGGDAIVIGGIDIISMPLDPPSKFRIAIGCLGKRPVRPAE